jgi:hypothetical protein
MRAFSNGRLGQSDQNRFGHRHGRYIDLNLNGQGFDPNERERF